MSEKTLILLFMTGTLVAFFSLGAQLDSINEEVERVQVESIVSSDMLKDLKPKPSPEMYTYAFRTYLPLEATRVVFEDSSAGLQSAVDAGADYIIAVTTDGQASLHSPALDL